MDGFDTRDLENYKKELMAASKQFPQLRRKCLTRIGFIVEGKTIKLTPRDTGNLRASIKSKVTSSSTVEIGTNTNYAKAVNDGHRQVRRFLPAKYLSRTVSGRKFLKKGNTKGIMLKTKFIPGVHFMEKGLQASQNQIDQEIDKMLESAEKLLGGV